MYKTLVYVAGPYTCGHPLENTNKAIDAAEQIAALGYVPFIPHLTHFWEARHHHEYEFWMQQDLTVLRRCDALLRLPGESRGADREVAEAELFGIKVYYSVDDMPNR
jgi:hypothetical protein